jgi:hypothetical protein
MDGKVMGQQSVAVQENTAETGGPVATPNAVATPNKVSEEIDAQIRRLRQVLTLMAPETGSAALGSARQPASRMPIGERMRLLTEYRR